jgi:hypothetical protein
LRMSLLASSLIHPDHGKGFSRSVFWHAIAQEMNGCERLQIAFVELKRFFDRRL